MNKLPIIKQVRQYKYVKVLGQGAYATVYLAHDDIAYFAVKEIKLDNLGDDDDSKKLLNYFDQEIQIYQNTNHINLVKLYEEFRENEVIYCIFEYCGKGDLNTFLKKKNLTEDEIKTIFTQILAGMKYLYSKGIVHRDLKLDNILINDENIIKIADFGFAKYAEQESILTSYCGTPATMAPEVLCNQEYDYKCDIWSLGVILYYMIYKRFHWQGNIRSVADLQMFLSKFIIKYHDLVFALSVPGKDILRKMLTRDKEQRINYDELFAHPWLEGKLDDQQNLLQSKYIIQQGSEISIGQRIGSAIYGLRYHKEQFLRLLNQFIKASRNQLAIQLFQAFIQKVMNQQFYITLVCGELKYEQNHELFDYSHQLYLIFSELYRNCILQNRETVVIEDVLLQFVKNTKLSNNIVFQLDHNVAKSFDDLIKIHNSIIEDKLEQDQQLNWSITTHMSDDPIHNLVERAFTLRKHLGEGDRVYNYHYKNIIDPLKN